MSIGASADSPPIKPRVCQVKEYIVFLDQVIGKGQFGTVVKAQRAADLLSSDDNSSKSKFVKPCLDNSKKIYACKIYENEFLSSEDMQMVLKEV